MRSPLPYNPAHKAPCLLHGQAQIGPGFPLVIEGIQLHGAQEQAIERSELAARLKSAQARHPQQAVLIAGDRSVRYEAVLNVMDELQRQQVAKIGLLVKPSK